MIIVLIAIAVVVSLTKFHILILSFWSLASVIIYSLTSARYSLPASLIFLTWWPLSFPFTILCSVVDQFLSVCHSSSTSLFYIFPQVVYINTLGTLSQCQVMSSYITNFTARYIVEKAVLRLLLGNCSVFS